MQKTLVGMCLVGILMVGGCSSKDDSSTADPVSACKSLMGALCSKVFGCLTKAQQDLLADQYGNNESDCNTKLGGSNCGAEMTKCDSGTSYDASNASECLHQVQSLSCAEFMDPNTATPAACAADKICH